MSLTNPRTSDPVTLACELDGIVPVERLSNGDVSSSELERNRSPLRLSIPLDAFRQQKDQAVAPYQALPVQGPIVNITEHLTPALDVIEPDRGETTEVILLKGIYLWQVPCRREAQETMPKSRLLRSEECCVY